uniref:Uncharacterized protein n=1 Tax=viral metagenome TaxID=1070528 RepID=A0A6C0IPR5_9ZZZZ
MEWSYGKNRMVSALERLIENKPKRKWYHYVCCCFNQTNEIEGTRLSVCFDE